MQLPYLSYTINGRSYPAGPQTLGLSAVTLVTERESGQVFYRTKWSGDITFTGDDFTLFWQLSQKSCCQSISVSLKRTGKTCTDATPYWKGVFSLSDLQFDIDAGTAKLTTPPRPNDGYQTLLENWNKTVNWLEISAIQSIYSSNRQRLYRRARLLTAVLAGMVGLTLKDTSAESLIPTAGTDTISAFLESATNPVTRRKNPFLNALVLQASDVVTPGPATGSTPTSGFATSAELTLKELIEDLQELCCLYPYIDPATGKLRWEHESFFPGLSYNPATVGFSLPDTSPEWAGKRIVKTDTSSLFGLYTLSIEPNITIGIDHIRDGSGSTEISTATDYGSGSIEFSDPCVTRMPGETPLTKNRSVSRIATDISGAVSWPDTVNKADWLFLVEASVSVTPGSTIPQIGSALVEQANQSVENGNFSATSLLRDFHRHNQPFPEGILNKQVQVLPNGYRRSMKSIAPIRELGGVSLAYCCTDTPVSLAAHIETWLGMDGTLKRASYRVADELLTLEINHPGPCQIPKDDVPFDPEEEPSPCPPRDTFLREEYQYEYRRGESAETGAQPCAVNKGTYYADGRCGEFSTNDFISNGC